MTAEDDQLARMRARADAMWEAAKQPGPYIDPVRESWIDHHAEMRAENRAYEHNQLEDREGQR
jgi:hypothetical protein